MLLLTVREWVGPTREAKIQTKPHVQLVGMATRLPLGAAIEAIHAYESAYKARFFAMAVEFNVVAVAAIEDLTDDQLAHGRIELIENLEARASDFGGESGGSKE